MQYRWLLFFADLMRYCQQSYSGRVPWGHTDEAVNGPTSTLLGERRQIRPDFSCTTGSFSGGGQCSTFMVCSDCTKKAGAGLPALNKMARTAWPHYVPCNNRHLMSTPPPAPRGRRFFVTVQNYRTNSEENFADSYGGVPQTRSRAWYRTKSCVGYRDSLGV